MALTKEEELELSQLEKELNSEQTPAVATNINKTDIFGNQYERGDLNVLGNIFNRPGAAIRSGIQGLIGGKSFVDEYIKGSNIPEEVPTFQEEAALGASDVASKLPRPLVGPAAFVMSSAAQLGGLVADTATNPADILATITGAKATTAIAETSVGKKIAEIATKKRSLIPNADQLIAKAEKLTTEVINPTKGELATANQRGIVLPAVKKSSSIIQKAKDYKQLGTQIQDTIDNTISQRNALIKADNYKVDEGYINKLQDFINEQKKLGQNADEIAQMEKVLGEERAYYVGNGGNFDRLSAQSRKEYFQDKTDRLLNKREKGTLVIDQEPGRTKALDVLRKGLKESVEGGNEKIKQLNSNYSGLLRARRLVAEQEALTQKEAKEGIVQQFTNTALALLRPKDAAVQTLQRARSLSSKTSEIEKLMTQANKTRVMELINNDPNTLSMKNSLKYFQQRGMKKAVLQTQQKIEERTAKQIVEGVGGKFKEVNRGDFAIKGKPTVYFNTPGGGTLSLPLKDISVDKVLKKIKDFESKGGRKSGPMSLTELNKKLNRK